MLGWCFGCDREETHSSGDRANVSGMYLHIIVSEYINGIPKRVYLSHSECANMYVNVSLKHRCHDGGPSRNDHRIGDDGGTNGSRRKCECARNEYGTYNVARSYSSQYRKYCVFRGIKHVVSRAFETDPAVCKRVCLDNQCSLSYRKYYRIMQSHRQTRDNGYVIRGNHSQYNESDRNVTHNVRMCCIGHNESYKESNGIHGSGDMGDGGTGWDPTPHPGIRDGGCLNGYIRSYSIVNIGICEQRNGRFIQCEQYSNAGIINSHFIIGVQIGIQSTGMSNSEADRINARIIIGVQISSRDLLYSEFGGINKQISIGVQILPYEELIRDTGSELVYICVPELVYQHSIQSEDGSVRYSTNVRIVSIGINGPPGSHNVNNVVLYRASKCVYEICQIIGKIPEYLIPIHIGSPSLQCYSMHERVTCYPGCFSSGLFLIITSVGVMIQSAVIIGKGQSISIRSEHVCIHSFISSYVFSLFPTIISITLDGQCVSDCCMG